MNYKQELIKMVTDDDVFASLTENLRNDFDIALHACRYSWEAHAHVGEKLWSDPLFVLELVKYERDQFLKNGFNESLQVHRLIGMCPNDIKEGITTDIDSSIPYHYEADEITGAGWMTEEGYKYQYNRAIESLCAIIELNNVGASYNGSSPLQAKEIIDFSNSLERSLSQATGQKPTKEPKL